MIIAQQKRKENIAEYILYMWQLEDLIRANNFDIDLLQKNVFGAYTQNPEQLQEIRTWYSGLIEMMTLEQIKQKGHMQVITNLVNDLNDIHLFMINQRGATQYQRAYTSAISSIKEFNQKMNGTAKNEIDVCFHALYAILLLKIQKKEISPETLKAIETFKKLIILLTKKYYELEAEDKKPDA